MTLFPFPLPPVVCEGAALSPLLLPRLDIIKASVMLPMGWVNILLYCFNLCLIMNEAEHLPTHLALAFIFMG